MLPVCQVCSPAHVIDLKAQRSFINWPNLSRAASRADNSPEIPSWTELVSAETDPPTAKPPNWGPFGGCQEISRFAGLRGGPGRIRTCNQKVISGKFGETIA
jgi:hypothetical protein